MAILIEFLSGSHAESHYSWLFMKISQWNGIIIKNNIKWYLDQIQIITCHIQSPKSTWLKKIFWVKNPISIKNAHFTDEIVFWLTLRIKEKLEIDQFLTDLTYYNLFLDSRHCSF